MNLIASKGKNCFKNKNYEFDKDFLSSDRNKAQIGLKYKENTITQLNSMFNGKILETPTIMYYLEHQDCKKLFQSSVFNRPENFLDLKYSLQFGFFGYCQIDHSSILKEDTELSQNFIFNKVMENNKLIEEFNPNSQDKIKLPKDTNIFVAIKTYLDSQTVISSLINTSKKLTNAYENLAYNGIKRKFWRNKHEYYLLYNNKRSDGIPALKYLENEDSTKLEDKSIKDTKVIYNGGYVQIASILSLQNQIRTMNIRLDKIEEEKEEMKIKKEKQKKALNLQKKEMKNEIDKLVEQLNIINKKMQIEKELNKFILANPV